MMLPTPDVPVLRDPVDPLTLLRAARKTAQAHSRVCQSMQCENAALRRELHRVQGNCQELKAACAALAVTCLTLIGMVLA